MRFAYFPLFTVRLRHGYYVNGASVDDFTIVPDPPTTRLLHKHGLRFLARGDGFAVFAEVEPDTLPKAPDDRPTLRSLDDTDVLRMHFHMHLRNPHLVNFSDLPDHRPGVNVFYFNNLQQDRDDSRLHLGDSVAGVRIGAPIELVTSSDYRHRFSAPVRSGTLTVTDIFGVAVHAFSFEHPADVAPTTEACLDLSAIDRIGAGRYLVTDHLGGSQAILYAPESPLDRPFGVIEIFTSTVGLAPGITRVPVDYRVFRGNTIHRVDDFYIQFEPRETTWRYRVTKKYEDVASGGIDVQTLIIDDGAAFTAVVDPDPKPKWATFTSNAPRVFREAPARLELKVAGDKKIRTLPVPRPETPLKKATVGDSERIVSDLFINV